MLWHFLVRIYNGEKLHEWIPKWWKVYLFWKASFVKWCKHLEVKSNAHLFQCYESININPELMNVFVLWLVLALVWNVIYLFTWLSKVVERSLYLIIIRDSNLKNPKFRGFEQTQIKNIQHWFWEEWIAL